MKKELGTVCDTAHKYAIARCECGHGWLAHHSYDQFLDRFVEHGCDHWSGCSCLYWAQAALAAARPEGGAG